MDVKPISSSRSNVWLSSEAGDIKELAALTSQVTNRDHAPQAAEIIKNIPIYEGSAIAPEGEDSDARRALSAEWNTVFDLGPGILAIRGAVPVAAVDQATEIFERIIEEERAAGTGAGDHFAKPGANDRVWNAAQKHCLADPENFASYFSSDAIALAATSWLGRGYQVTAQVNRVNPGGAAQSPHRDYHLGFMTADQLATYPVQAHILSPALTLQGAIAHCDMSIESGPTMLLPFSQQFKEGYVAFGRPEFQEHFEDAYVQLPLEKGDALFFNPAVMHAAGTNRTTNVQRMANLLQIGSAFGRSIESVDRTSMSKAAYPILLRGEFSPLEKFNVIAACAEGYAFPTNLDSDPPIGGLIPLSQAEHMAKALEEAMPPEEFNQMLDERDAARAS